MKFVETQLNYLKNALKIIIFLLVIFELNS